MIYHEVLLPVAVIWTIAAITPGPNFFITVHTAVAQNRKSALYTVAGIVFGTLIWSVSGFLGISILFKAAPMLYYSLKIIGGLYLIYLGGRLLFSRKNNGETSGKREPLTSLDCFRLGFNTNILNPKTAAFMAGLFAATIPPHASFELGATCSLLICGISTLWYSMVALVFSLDRARRAYQRFKRRIQQAAGIVFIAFGLKLAVTD